MTLLLYIILYLNNSISADLKDNSVEDYVNVKEECI